MREYFSSSPARNGQEKGLTLLELLIVLILVSLISVYIFLSVIGSVRSARDAKRRIDLDQISKVFAIYYLDHGYYIPAFNAGVAKFSCGITVSSWGDCSIILQEVRPYIGGLPFDPLDQPIPGGNTDCLQAPCYWYSTVDPAHSNYCLCANLEATDKINRPPVCSGVTQNYCVTGAL